MKLPVAAVFFAAASKPLIFAVVKFAPEFIVTKVVVLPEVPPVITAVLLNTTAPPLFTVALPPVVIVRLLLPLFTFNVPFTTKVFALLAASTVTVCPFCIVVEVALAPGTIIALTQLILSWDSSHVETALQFPVVLDLKKSVALLIKLTVNELLVPVSIPPLVLVAVIVKVPLLAIVTL